MPGLEGTMWGIGKLLFNDFFPNIRPPIDFPMTVLGRDASH